MSKRKEFAIFQRTVDLGNESSHLNIADMNKDGEGTEGNIKKAVHHYEIRIKHNLVDGHWNLALIYGSEPDFHNRNRSVYHYRIAADLGHSKAIEIVAKYL